MSQVSVAAGFMAMLPMAETLTGWSMPQAAPSWIGARSA